MARWSHTAPSDPDKSWMGKGQTIKSSDVHVSPGMREFFLVQVDSRNDDAICNCSNVLQGKSKPFCRDENQIPFNLKLISAHKILELCHSYILEQNESFIFLSKRNNFYFQVMSSSPVKQDKLKQL